MHLILETWRYSLVLHTKDDLTHLPQQNGHHFVDGTFQCIILNVNDCILIRIPLKFVRKGPIDNMPALVQVMAWHRADNKPLSEPMMTQFIDAYVQY